ncbi:MAG: flagellar motor protein MotB [Rhodanobacteraceae bacterium]
MSEGKPVVIIRRKVAAAEGFHGGAWKIALADFMTALMALFLVLWVIATATPEQRHGLSDYFSMSLTQAISGGDKTSASDSVIPGGAPDPTYNNGEKSKIHPQVRNQPDAQRRRLRELRDQITVAIDHDRNLQSVRDQLRFEMTPEGLRIAMVDSEQRPMFEVGSDKLEPYMRDLLHTIAPLLNQLPNELRIYGYTGNRPFANAEHGYGNWELSAARANASRRELVAAGLDRDKLLSVSGVADKVPLPGTAPDDPANRRIELMVLTAQAANNIRNGAPAMNLGAPADPVQADR